MRHTRWVWLVVGSFALAACDAFTGIDGDEAADLVVTPGRDTLSALQDTVALAAEVRDREGRVIASPRVVWASLDTSVARVDSLGRVVSMDVGTARITATSGSAADTAEITVRSGVPSHQLGFVRFAGGVPAILTRDTTVWVTTERGGEIRLRYRPPGGGSGGREFLRFRVPGRSLLRRPGGAPFGERDSIQVRLEIEDPARFVFRFSPSGLRFDPDRPAELEVLYEGAEPGDVAAEDLLAVWRQEQPGEPWVQISTVRLKENDEARARITGFTGFALATNRGDF